jgi:large subunit ribosomal protein L1
MAKHGKNYNSAKEKIDANKAYALADAVKLVKEVAFTKFDSTVELHIRMGVDPRHADQQVRDVVVLPHGLGKTVKVLVFAEGEAAKIAEEAGADYVADDEMINEIQKGWTDFDVAIATPDMMGKAGRLGRVLGPRGLMPNPKAGTVAPAERLAEAIEASKAGRVEFRVDRTANIHCPVGKISFDDGKLVENLTVLIDAINKARPAASKGTYLRKLTLTSTMGPAVRIDPSSLR